MDHVHATFAVADSVERVMVEQVHLLVGWYHVDPATVSTVLLGLSSPGRTKHERRPGFEVNVRGFVSKAMPGGRRRTWAVTSTTPTTRPSSSSEGGPEPRSVTPGLRRPGLAFTFT